MMASIRRGLRHKKKMAPSGATKFEKVYVQRNKIAVFQVKFKNSRTGVG